jgi:DNA-binding NarL/FixJ family response regulator
MLCERCFRAEATVHVTRVRKMRCAGEAHLCLPCGELYLAEDLGLGSWREAERMLSLEPAQWFTVYMCITDHLYASRLSEYLSSRHLFTEALDSLTREHTRGQGGIVIADIDTVAEVRRRAPEALVVVAESGRTRSSALDAMRLGANDYVFSGPADFAQLADVVAELAKALSP